MSNPKVTGPQTLLRWLRRAAIAALATEAVACQSLPTAQMRWVGRAGLAAESTRPCTPRELQWFRGDAQRPKRYSWKDRQPHEARVASGSLWLLSTSAKLLRFGLPNGPLEIVNVDDDVADLEQTPLGLLLLTRSKSEPQERVRIWRYTGTDWKELGRPDLPSCAVTPQLSGAGRELVVTDNRGRFLMSSDGLRWRRTPFIHRAPPFAERMLCTHEQFCVLGGDHGEFGGSFRLYDLRRDPATRPLRDDGSAQSQNVTAVLADPERPRCLLVGLGYSHMGMYNGGVVRACPDSTTFAVEHMPVFAPNAVSGGPGPVLSLAASPRGYYMLTRAGLFEVVDGQPQAVTLEHVETVDGVRITRELPGVLVLFYTESLRARQLVEVRPPSKLSD